jgi:hypothetical protein
LVRDGLCPGMTVAACDWGSGASVISVTFAIRDFVLPELTWLGINHG